ncbi:hypothetical protein CCZ01_04630 [Helicobacter monodelphidis]|uniref:hypothetical protein n=1 Tax=Helicobacter sp. 15-1451 TaxID=2004995 RepID=UPI000DCD1827|nr:hypothetical protein [Helicobacter sp. 15-1451]RAX57919.1 hypothetical protein CCZ01_04630 [Helicobacter sp. 15-1451]
MIIAVPVFDDGLKIFTNTGHSPYFAIFEQKGKGMFKSFDLLEMRTNPRGNKEAEKGCSHSEDEDTEAHIHGHLVLAEMVKGVDIVLVKHACANTTKVMQNAGAKICKIPQNIQMAKEALSQANMQ